MTIKIKFTGLAICEYNGRGKGCTVTYEMEGDPNRLTPAEFKDVFQSTLKDLGWNYGDGIHTRCPTHKGRRGSKAFNHSLVTPLPPPLPPPLPLHELTEEEWPRKKK